jgi:tetratricopeptide (TPR) repeat protein
MAEIFLQTYSEQIEGMIAQGRYTEAVAHGRHILTQYPKYVNAYELLGKAMLEARQSEYAADMFRRVLSADPEDMLAWVAMSEVYNQGDELNAALWCMERAFELATDNSLVEEELRQLYARRDGAEPSRIHLTRGALARLYLKGDLLPRAISEFRALLAEHPGRVDLAVALAEALWRNEQRLEASEVCQDVLDRQSYCLKANLILGDIWTSSGREEGQMYLRRAEALDPENRMAQAFFGAASPLLAREVQVTPLEYGPAVAEGRPVWMGDAGAVSLGGPPLTEREATLIDIAAGLEAQIEIPAWLEEIDVGETSEPLLSGPVEQLGEPLSEEALLPLEGEPTPALGEIPDWLQEIAPPEPALGIVKEAVVTEEVAGQVVGLAPESIGEETEDMRGEGEEIPGWLSELGAEPVGEGEPPAAPGEEGIPEWLSEVSAATLGVGEAPPASPTEEQPPDWLAGVRDQFGEEAPALEPVAAEEKVAPGDVLQETPSSTAEGDAMPAWLEGEGMPSGDEALAWLEQLAAGKEEELLAQVEAESEIRMAEIMGRPKPVKPPVEEPVMEEPVPTVSEPAPAEIPDWLQKLAPSELALGAAEEAAIPETVPPADLSFAPTVEAALEETAAPAGEEAFGWTAFGEPEASPEIAPLEEELPPVEAGPPEMPVVEAPLPAAEEAAMPAWLEGEGVPSGDEALAWLEQLAAGKEGELMAQIEAESEIRMAEIMGRPKPKEPPAEEVVPEKVAAPSMEEVAAPLAEEAFGWTTFGEPEAPPEADVAAEEALPVTEKAPERAALEEVEAPPVVELPVSEEMPVAEKAPVSEAAPPGEELEWGEALDILLEEEVPAVAEAAGVPEAGVAEAIEEAIVTPETPAARVPAEPESFAAERAYLKEHPRDHEARLALARALWQTGEREEALEAYYRVIRVGKFLDSVIPELEEYLEQWPSVGMQRVLGDAYMKDGRLQDALDLYRLALESL